MASGPLGRDQLSRQRARRVGAVGFAIACVLPFALWHNVMADILAEARIDRRDRDRRFYGTPTAAWFAWGVTLYLLGFGLATQVAQMAGGLSAY
jgi:hypothetical protein